MNTTRRLTFLAAAVLVAGLLAGPAFAVDEPAGVATEQPADGTGRIQMAETPRDRLGLLLLAALVVGSGLAFANGRRQLKGEHPKATGEFRWR